jgi:hypothetical protein
MKTLIAFLALASSAVACDGALGLNGDCYSQQIVQRVVVHPQRVQRVQRVQVVEKVQVVERVQKVQRVQRNRQRGFSLNIQRSRG